MWQRRQGPPPPPPPPPPPLPPPPPPPPPSWAAAAPSAQEVDAFKDKESAAPTDPRAWLSPRRTLRQIEVRCGRVGDQREACERYGSAPSLVCRDGDLFGPGGFWPPIATPKHEHTSSGRRAARSSATKGRGTAQHGLGRRRPDRAARRETRTEGATRTSANDEDPSAIQRGRRRGIGWTRPRGKLRGRTHVKVHVGDKTWPRRRIDTA